MEHMINQMKSITGKTESEYLKYATIALINDRERTEYSNNKILKSKVWCKKCGIAYLEDVSLKCPLCKLKEEIKDDIELEKLRIQTDIMDYLLETMK